MTVPMLPSAYLRAPIAHRGLHGPGVPENSRAAIAAAADLGYGVELDLHLSADGVPMVFHDRGLSRLTGQEGNLRDRTAEALGAVALKGGNEGIPTFAEVLRLVAGRVPLLVELKDRTGAFEPSDGAFEAAVARDIEGYSGELAFMSFNPSLAAGMARAVPGRPRGLVTETFPPEEWPGLTAERCAELARIERVDEVGAAFVSHDWTDLASPRIAELAGQGLTILCWTVTSAKDEAVARQVAHNITFEGYRAEIAG